MCKLLSKSPSLCKILWSLQKRKRNTWGETQKDFVFLEVRKIVGTYIGENSYTSVAQRVDTINQDNKYSALWEKLTELEPNNWPRFLEQLKKSYQATQEESKDTETGSVAKTENRLDSPTKTILPNNNTPKSKPLRSPIHPLTFEVNNGKKETKEISPSGMINRCLSEKQPQEKYQANQKTQWLQ